MLTPGQSRPIRLPKNAQEHSDRKSSTRRKGALLAEKYKFFQIGTSGKCGNSSKLLAASCWPRRDPRQVAAVRVFGNPGRIGIYIAAADGTDEHPLLSSADSDYDPVWAPDSSSIVFTSERDGSAELYRARLDGGGLEGLTNDPAYDDQAAFSPDGRQLVFVTTRNGGHAVLWILDLRSPRPRRFAPCRNVYGKTRHFSGTADLQRIRRQLGSILPYPSRKDRNKNTAIVSNWKRELER